MSTYFVFPFVRLLCDCEDEAYTDKMPSVKSFDSQKIRQYITLMELKTEILRLETRLDAYNLYLKLKPEDWGESERDFTEWAGYSRQSYYTWPEDGLPEKLKYQLIGRLSALLENRGTE